MPVECFDIHVSSDLDNLCSVWGVAFILCRQKRGCGVYLPSMTFIPFFVMSHRPLGPSLSACPSLARCIRISRINVPRLGRSSRRRMSVVKRIALAILRHLSANVSRGFHGYSTFVSPCQSIIGRANFGRSYAFRLCPISSCFPRCCFQQRSWSKICGVRFTE